MNNFDKCPVCSSRKRQEQPEPISGRQDVFYVCGCAVTYEVENPENFEQTGECENKIDWTDIYIDYGKEFDENARLVDNRFYGWVELQFYKEIHYANNWKNIVNFLDKEILDEYFENKEMYIKNLREMNEGPDVIKVELPDLDYTDRPVRRTLIKDYHQEPIVGNFVLEEIETFEREGFQVNIYKIVASKDHVDKIGSFIVEEICDNYKKNRINFYESGIIDIINAL